MSGDSAAVGNNPPESEPRKGPIDLLGTVFQEYEVQIISIMGLLVGYAAILMHSILGLDKPAYTLSGVALLTILLLAINKTANFFQPRWWLRAVATVLVCLVFTAPQLNASLEAIKKTKAAEFAESKFRAINGVRELQPQPVPEDLKISGQIPTR